MTKRAALSAGVRLHNSLARSLWPTSTADALATRKKNATLAMELSEKKRAEIAAVNLLSVPFFNDRDIEDLLAAHPQAEAVDLIRREVVLGAEKLKVTLQRIRDMSLSSRCFPFQAGEKLSEYKLEPLSPLGLVQTIVKSNDQWQTTNTPPYIGRSSPINHRKHLLTSNRIDSSEEYAFTSKSYSI